MSVVTLMVWIVWATSRMHCGSACSLVRATKMPGCARPKEHVCMLASTGMNHACGTQSGKQ